MSVFCLLWEFLPLLLLSTLALSSSSRHSSEGSFTLSHLSHPLPLSRPPAAIRHGRKMQMCPLGVTLEGWRVECGGIVPSVTSTPTPPCALPTLMPLPSPIQSQLTSVSCYLDGSLLAVDGLGTSLINEMYDNVIFFNRMT